MVKTERKRINKMNCKDILIEWLKEHGYDGLAAPKFECGGCGFENFAPCNGVDLDLCEAGYYNPDKDGWYEE